MKKLSLFLCSILTFCLLTLHPASVALADAPSSNSKLDAMLQKAMQDETTPKLQGQLTGKSGNTYSVDVYELDTSQLSRDLDLADDNVNSLTLVADLDSIRPLDANSNAGIEEWDRSQSVCFYNTIYYKTVTDDAGFQQVLLVAVEGNYKIHESAVQILDQTVSFGCTGNRAASQSQFTNKTPQDSHYFYYTGFDVAVPDDFTGQIGCVYQAVIKRNSSQWTYTLPNTL